MAQTVKERTVLETPENIEVVVTYDMRREALLDNATHNGISAGRGANALLDTARAFQMAIFDEVATDADAEKVYDAYALGYRSTGAELSTDSAAAQVSAFKTFASKPAVYAEMRLNVQADVARLHAELGSDDRAASLYASFCKINRELVAEVKKTGKLETLVDVVDDAWILSHIRKAVVGKKDDLAKLADIVAALGKLAKGDLGKQEPRVAKAAAYIKGLHDMIAAGAGLPDMSE